MNTIISINTIVLPTGVPATTAMVSPINEHTTEYIAELIVTDLNVLNTRMLDKAGNMIKADISSEPTKFIDNTIIMAIITDIIKL